MNEKIYNKKVSIIVPIIICFEIISINDSNLKKNNVLK